jgi:DNA-binding GntR family transcriptional regulator
MESLYSLGQRELVTEPDMAFHRQLVLCAHHHRLAAAWEQVAGIAATLLRVALTFTPRLATDPDSERAVMDALAAAEREVRDPQANEQAILRALADRDAEATEQTVREHLRNGERLVQEALKTHLLALAGSPA